MDRFSAALDRFSDTIAQKLSDAQKIFDTTIATMKAAADANAAQVTRIVENMNAAACNNAVPDTFTVSISDLMSGLLAIFILVLSYFILNFTQATAQLTQNDITRAELLHFMQRELEREGIKVTVDDRHGILRIAEDVLFDVGLADVKPQGQIVIQKLSAVLAVALEAEQFKGRVETIFIEGHTDNVPISNGVFPSNWELSAKRAINTWLTMSGANPQLTALRNDKDEMIFSVSGYADTRPIAANTSEAGRGDNRRIDIRFSMAPPTEANMSIVKFVRKELAQ
ncbi:MAG: OmpA family protein [Quinella sp. 1Q7]|nr:OmpA family protein [Quinella sp. 1Q7]